MNRCLITYEPCGKENYSAKGLKKLSQNLDHLELFSYSAEEQRAEAFIRAAKISVQGVQPKLSAIVNIRDSKFEIVDTDGKYILKPQHHLFPQLPENEDLTMRMAEVSGINVPLHGLIKSKDNSLTYFIKRFDRVGHLDKIPVEDFAQLARLKRDTKYNYSMEKLVLLIDEYCTFPMVEKAKLFKLVLFNYLTGNEDMHLKNYSVIRSGDKIELSPAYDLLNSTIVLKPGAEEIALTLSGKKRNLTKKILIEYFGKDRCNLTEKVIENTLNIIKNSYGQWFGLLEISFLNKDLKDKYAGLLEKRIKVLDI